MAGAYEIIKEIMGTACIHNGDEHPTLPPPEGMSSRSPAPDDSTVLSDAPEVLNDPRAPPGLR